MNKRTRDSFYSLWTVAILICLAVCIFLLAYVSIVDGGEAASVSGGADTSDAAATVSVSDPTLAESADMGQTYQDWLVFLGGSSTYDLYACGVLPRYQVWTPPSGTMTLSGWAEGQIEYYAFGDTENVQYLSVADCAAQRQPEYLIITLGLEDLSLLDEDQFKQLYTDLINTVLASSPDTRIMCQSIFPVIDELVDDSMKNDLINTANGWIYQAAALTGTRYLNTRDALVDSDGNLLSEYNTGDGIHLNANGYNAVLQYIRTHGYQ